SGHLSRAIPVAPHRRSRGPGACPVKRSRLVRYDDRQRENREHAGCGIVECERSAKRPSDQRDEGESQSGPRIIVRAPEEWFGELGQRIARYAGSGVLNAQGQGRGFGVDLYRRRTTSMTQGVVEEVG